MTTSTSLDHSKHSNQSLIDKPLNNSTTSLHDNILTTSISRKDMEPGIYDISKAYHQGPGISRSALMTFKRSPYHYWY